MINQKSANVISTLVGSLLESSPVQLIGNLETSFSIEKLLKEKHESSDLLTWQSTFYNLHNLFAILPYLLGTKLLNFLYYYSIAFLSFRNIMENLDVWFTYKL